MNLKELQRISLLVLTRANFFFSASNVESGDIKLNIVPTFAFIFKRSLFMYFDSLLFNPSIYLIADLVISSSFFP